MPERKTARRGAKVTCELAFVGSDASATAHGMVLPVDGGNHLGGM